MFLVVDLTSSFRSKRQSRWLECRTRQDEFMHSALITKRLIKLCVKGLPVKQYSQGKSLNHTSKVPNNTDSYPSNLFTPPQRYDPVILHAAEV